MLGKTYLSEVDRVLGAFLLCIACAPLSFASAIPGQDSAKSTAEPLEEIIVYGKKNIVRMRNEVYHAEDDFYALFNEINLDDDYDVECVPLFRIQALRRVRECKAGFHMKWDEHLVIHGWQPPISFIRRKERELEQKLLQHVASNPDLTQAFLELAKVKKDYEDELQRRREKN